MGHISMGVDFSSDRHPRGLMNARTTTAAVSFPINFVGLVNVRHYKAIAISI